MANTHTHICRQLVIAAVGHYFGHYVSFVATPLDIHAHSTVAREGERGKEGRKGGKVARKVGVRGACLWLLGGGQLKGSPDSGKCLRLKPPQNSHVVYLR